MTAAAFAIAIGYGLIAPVLPRFAEKFSTTVSATTLVVSAFAMFRLLWAPAAGGLVQRLGERRIYITGVLCVAASSAATAFASSYWQLLIFRSLGGIGSVMFTVASTGLIVKLSPPAIRGRVSALYTATFLIGSIAGPILGGLLAEAGLQVPFLVYAASLVLAAVVVALLLPDTGRSAKGSELPAMGFKEALAVPAYRACLTTGFSNGWTNFGIRISLVPLFVSSAVSADPKAGGIVLAAFALGNAVVLPFSSRFADTVGRRPLILVGAIGAGAFTAAFGLSNGMPIMLGLSVVAGLATGLLGPGQQAALADIVGSGRSAGPVLAAFQMSQDIGSIVGPLLAAQIADLFGFSWAFIVSGLVLVVSTLPWFGVKDTLAAKKS